MKKLVRFPFLFFILICLGVSIFLTTSRPQSNHQNEEILSVRIEEITDRSTISFEQRQYVQQQLKVSLDGRDETVTVSSNIILDGSPAEYEKGDRILIGKIADKGSDPSYYVIGYDRTHLLIILSALFIILVLLVTKSQGLKAIAGMIYTFVIIYTIILPLFLDKHHPLLVSILGMGLIIPPTFLLTHGKNQKTYAAMIATTLTLVLTGLLAYLVIVTSKLTGITTEEIETLFYTSDGLYDLGGLLLAGIIIGTLGILDDVSISQASVVSELRTTSRSLTKKELFAKAMNVGRDHIASVVNTLILVYTGASLSTLLLFLTFPRPFLVLLNDEAVVIQIVIALIGSIGLILAVPITTLIAIKFIFTKDVKQRGRA